jgi:hypothetical protein
MQVREQNHVERLRAEGLHTRVSPILAGDHRSMEGYPRDDDFDIAD